ncbi:hypothetical protein N9753_01260 [Gammaproteobacteria bacterium]|nr:hypothetical protein [Gammaproteobacteria bacterium]MDB4183576.1 hypothetical protein [Gammaproteobacteria bacterium]
MVKLSFQDQSCNITLEEGLEEYRAYLQANGKKQLIDKPNSTVIRDHDATHVIFGLDTSIEQESLLDSWVLRGCDWRFKELLAYGQLPELKELNKYLQKEVGYLKLILAVFKLIPLKRKIWRRTKAMNKKWPFKSPDSLMNQRVCDLREEYGIRILEPEERMIKDPLIWEGTISN